MFGDWGQTDSAGDNPDTTRLLGQLANSGARFAVTVGDNGYPAGSQTNYGDLKQHAADTSVVFGPGFWTLVGKSLPLFATPGNHGFSSGTATRSTEQINWPQNQAVATSGGRYVRETYCCVNGTALRVVPERLVRVRRRQRPLLRAERRLGRRQRGHGLGVQRRLRGPLGSRAHPSTSGCRPTSPPTRRG